MVDEIIARNELIVLNRCRDFTFRRRAGGGGGIINLTIAIPSLASRIGDWCVVEVITLSDHHCIEFSIQERSHPVNAGRGHSLPGHGHGRTADSMYWWNDPLSVLRRECLTARRIFIRSKNDTLLREAWKIAKSALRQGIMKSRI